MQLIKLIFFYVFLLYLVSCSPKTDSNTILFSLQEDLNSGNISELKMLADSVRISCAENLPLVRKADSLAQIAERLGLDFSLNKANVIQQIEALTGSITKEQIDDWEKKGWLEWRVLDGKKMYFNRAASNLILLQNFYERRKESEKKKAEDPDMIFRLKHAEEVYTTSDKLRGPVAPVKMKVTYTIRVEKDAVPEGETIRCWLPWPESNTPRQDMIVLTGTSEPDFLIAPDSAIHSTVYMEKMSKKGEPSFFQVSFSYQSAPLYFDLTEAKILPYDKSSDLYKKYTAEQLPQICFTDNIRRLADSITGNDDDPAVVARKIYLWIKENITWTGALEYSIMPNIPEYVIKNRRGDCGMQTFLFMSMLRYKGIPVKWQSGWMMPPGSENLHDWCEVYYEGVGWVPADISYDLQPTENKPVREFYFSGIDAYRLILNEGVAGRIYPEKKFMRSEPYDFQRGEVEWSGGNLYFDKWDYEMRIEYVK